MTQPEQDTASVLIVEDEALIRMDLAELLVDEGFAVFEAEDAQEALAVLAEQPRIDLLLTDVNLPGGMDGIGLAARAIERHAGLRLIVSSGRERFHESSLPDHGRFLPKPYRYEQLVSLVKEELARPGQGDPAPIDPRVGLTSVGIR